MQSKMADDLEFNTKFVKLIEQYNVLYDHTIEGSSNRTVQEKAWREIADELGENWMNCKEKWKNIRSCYTRHLRQKAKDKSNFKKPYYLAKQLEFLLPYCKSVTSTNSTPPFSSPSQIILWNKIENIDDESQEDPLLFNNKEEETTIDDNTYFEEEAPEEETQKIDIVEDEAIKPTQEVEVTTIPASASPVRRWRNRKRKLIYSSGKPGHDFSTVKQNHTSSEDADLNFFKSLLPCVHHMTNKQKNRLKIKILNEINVILYSDESEHVD